ncbi:MAG TPA: hypothetical protein VK835_15335 [Bacteroidia bacterium]|nr:hypothetical protein [Bacteroidia bacterium]
MKVEDIILNLREQINSFRATDLYNSSKPLKFDINSIEIALNLSELGINNNRAIEANEENWFKGGYLIANDFCGEWEDISVLYNKLVDEVKKKKYFRK